MFVIALIGLIRGLMSISSKSWAGAVIVLLFSVFCLIGAIVFWAGWATLDWSLLDGS